MNINWKAWSWSWSSNTLMTWWEEPAHWKRSWCWERLRAGGVGGDRRWDGWMHHWFNGHEFEQTPGDSEGQENLMFCSPCGHKELDTTEWLNTNNMVLICISLMISAFEHLFIHLLVICRSSRNYLLESFANFFNWFFFLLSSRRQIRYQINLWNKWFPNIFSNSVCCLFILLNHFWLCEVAGCVSWQCDTGCGGLVTKSCPTLCNPVDCNPSGSSVHGIFQARILEWVLISFSRGSSSPTYRT